MRYFTWYDVDVEFEKNRMKWPESWNRVDVYNDEIIINVTGELYNAEDNHNVLREIFGKCYYENNIEIEFDHTKLPLIYEEGDETDKTFPVKVPLFKDIYLENKPEGWKDELPGVPIAAFHSYKGGVGRTLSLISLTREISEIYENSKKVLVIDADIEAPGLTWMLNRENSNAPISYLDILSLMHFNKIDENLAKNIAKLIEKSRLVVETERLEVEQYFLPVYREEGQVMNIFSNPEKIISSQNNKYIISEFLSIIGKELGVDLILLDLRAGITNFSAPFLFDSRVHKYFVSSTSMQSVKGIKLILDEIHKKTNNVGLLNSKLLLTMIPTEMEDITINRIEDELVEKTEEELENGEDSETASFLRENYLIRIPFDSTLISLGDFREICNILKGKNISDTMNLIAQGVFAKDSDEINELSLEDIKDTLQKLNDIAKEETTAEGNVSSNMLSTTSIREIVKDYKDITPQIVVLGAKGSGKTYIYKQMISKKTWGDFVEIVDKDGSVDTKETLILPLISTVNINMLNPLIRESIENVNAAFSAFNIDTDAVNINYDKMTQCSEDAMQLTDWSKAWKNLMINMLGSTFQDLTEIDKYLQQQEKRIIFLVDGLEDLFMNTQIKKQENWKLAIRSLCQNVVNELRNLQFGNVGIIVFARKDMVEEAIEINFEQFKNQYSRYELKWTQTEALRLALWIASKANPSLGKNSDILKASREVLEENLELLWGKKLGKRDSREAISSRWIIAALSDFNGQLQARDIVRFLKFATNNVSDVKLTYKDRYIMPSEIRKAIPDCSNDKFKEIKDEMKAMYNILKKFEDMNETDKQLPLTLDKISLTGEEIAKLENQGYLITVDKKYYLPEIIRFALGFKYEKGARPKVLSLLVK